MTRSCCASVVCSFVLSLDVGGCGGQSLSAAAAPTSEPAGAQAPTSAAGGAPPPAAENKPNGEVPGSSAYTVSDIAIVPAHPTDLPNPVPKPWIETPGFEQVLGKDWVPAYKVLLKLTNWNQPPAGSYVQFLFDVRPLAPMTYRGGINPPDLAAPDGLAEGEHVLAA